MTLALRVTSCLFRLALRGYSVASLPRSFALRARIFGRFAPSKFSKNKSVSQSTQNGLKRVKMQKKNFTPLTRFVRSAASAASGEAQPLPLRSLRSLGLRASRSYSQLLRSIGLRASRSRFSVASLSWALRYALATYPMSLPGSQGVSMPSFMPIGPKLWALEGYIHTHTQTDTQTVLLLLYRCF